MSDFAVADIGRLVEAAPRVHHHPADALVLEQRPAFQHVHELHVAIVPVPFAVRGLLRLRSPRRANFASFRCATWKRLLISPEIVG